jgi:hypothetical protein
MAETFHKSSGNVFEDIGFMPKDAPELRVKSTLSTAIPGNDRTPWSHSEAGG